MVIENVKDSDLYVDFGGKFHAVVPQPENAFYPRGSLVRIRLRDPEMTNQFMINTKAISLHEADATLLGPYRGHLATGSKTNDDDGLFDASTLLPYYHTKPSTCSNKTVVHADNWIIE